MKNLSSKLKKAFIGAGLISSLSTLNGQEIESKKIVLLTEKDFIKEQVEIRGIKQEVLSDILYDLDTDRKIILSDKFLKEAAKQKGWDYLSFFEKEGCELLLDIHFEKLFPSQKKYFGKSFFVLKEENINFDNTESGIINFVLEKTKNMSYKEVLENSEIKNDNEDYKKRIYIVRTDKNNIFAIRYLENNYQERKMKLEIYKIKEARR